MNIPVNSRDITLQSTEPRVLQISANYLVLNASSLQFKYGTDNVAQPAQITVTASLVGKLQGTVVFTTSGFTEPPSVDPADPNKLIIDPSKFISDFATINASVNWQGSAYLATPVTITRILNQLVAKVQNPIDLVPTYNDGSGYTLPTADNYVELYNGVVKITEGITYGPASQTINGLTVSVNNTTGKITLSQTGPNAWVGSSTNFTLTATRNNIVYNATYTITKAKAGVGGLQGKELSLYIWSVGIPALPNGTSTYTWTTDTQVYNGGDQWSITAPANPGTVGIGLWKATKNISAEASVVNTQISTTWVGGTVRAITTEANEVIKTKTVIAYINASSIPSIYGTTTLTWSSGAYSAPSGWSLEAPARIAGYTLYSAEVFIQAATAQVTSTIDWTQASIVPISYYGTDGAAARRAYVLATTAPAGSPTMSTTIGDGLPVVGSWFAGKTWNFSAPTVIAEGEILYQSDGVYVSGGNTTWGYPYISSLKVGNLQAISANTGNLSVTGSIKGGNATALTAGTGFYVDNNGYLRVGDPAGAQLKFDGNGLSITDASGANVFTVVSNAQNAASQAQQAATNAADSASSAVAVAGSVTWLGDPSVKIVTGTQLQRVTNPSYTDYSWNSQKYSAESYTAGAYISFIPGNIYNHLMVGLDSNPIENSSYNTIDYAWYCLNDATLNIYENGVAIGTQGSYTTSTVLSIIYDGRYVKYYKDGVLKRTVDKGIGSNLKLYADSSFYSIGAEAKSLRFGPVGAIGADGTPATVSVGTITTGSPGTSATVTNSGTSNAAVLNFTIPAGQTGAPSTVPGERGSLAGYGKQYGIYSASWSDAKANRIIYNMLNNQTSTADLASTSHLRIGDTVTITNAASATAASTRYWTGSWTDPSVVINGGLIVQGTIGADKLAANSILVGHTIQNSATNPTMVLNFGASPYISISV